ncbi:EexN family lipoprotein [Azospirillum sp.]|uniref:EexN family lipoprotein n=1 Tax=Azospirillum sp. TaxID=34012 RepID=UPI002D4BB61C|nr:EexN family lipoprotein [Azospirillum sp.]HYD70747.1 EexN family lipoprotein [Azospirillum sp.]
MGPVTTAWACTVQALTLLVPLLSGAPAAAQKPSAAPPRTVGWYADHPQARASVQLACLEDPGRLGRDADCLNAHRANVEVALREARARTGTMDPNDPAFWSSDPENRQSKLIMCRRNPQLNHCDVAMRSLLMEAGASGR